MAGGCFKVISGWRGKRLGFFGKARPGFLSFDNAITQVFVPPALVTFEFGRRTFFAVDAGGVFEFYPSRRFAFRVDVGDTIIRYPRIAANNVGGFVPAATTHNFQVSTGIQFRFR